MKEDLMHPFARLFTALMAVAFVGTTVGCLEPLPPYEPGPGQEVEENNDTPVELTPHQEWEQEFELQGTTCDELYDDARTRQALIDAGGWGETASGYIHIGRCVSGPGQPAYFMEGCDGVLPNTPTWEPLYGCSPCQVCIPLDPQTVASIAGIGRNEAERLNLGSCRPLDEPHITECIDWWNDPNRDRPDCPRLKEHFLPDLNCPPPFTCQELIDAGLGNLAEDCDEGN